MWKEKLITKAIERRNNFDKLFNGMIAALDSLATINLNYCNSLLRLYRRHEKDIYLYAVPETDKSIKSIIGHITVDHTYIRIQDSNNTEVIKTSSINKAMKVIISMLADLVNVDYYIQLKLNSELNASEERASHD